MRGENTKKNDDTVQHIKYLAGVARVKQAADKINAIEVEKFGPSHCTAVKPASLPNKSLRLSMCVAYLELEEEERERTSKREKIKGIFRKTPDMSMDSVSSGNGTVQVIRVSAGLSNADRQEKLEHDYIEGYAGQSIDVDYTGEAVLTVAVLRKLTHAERVKQSVNNKVPLFHQVKSAVKDYYQSPYELGGAENKLPVGLNISRGEAEISFVSLMCLLIAESHATVEVQVYKYGLYVGKMRILWKYRVKTFDEALLALDRLILSVHNASHSCSHLHKFSSLTKFKRNLEILRALGESSEQKDLSSFRKHLLDSLKLAQSCVNPSIRFSLLELPIKATPEKKAQSVIKSSCDSKKSHSHNSQESQNRSHDRMSVSDRLDMRADDQDMDDQSLRNALSESPREPPPPVAQVSDSDNSNLCPQRISELASFQSINLLTGIEKKENVGRQTQVIQASQPVSCLAGCNSDALLIVRQTFSDSLEAARRWFSGGLVIFG